MNKTEKAMNFALYAMGMSLLFIGIGMAAPGIGSAVAMALAAKGGANIEIK